MTSDLKPAFEHVRLMEVRIANQTAAIERLRQSGQDFSEAARRLALLERVLEEMRIQLGQLSPSEMDRKRPESGTPQSRATRKK